MKNILASNNEIKEIVDTVDNIRVKRFIIVRVIIKLEYMSDEMRRVK